LRGAVGQRSAFALSAVLVVQPRKRDQEGKREEDPDSWVQTDGSQPVVQRDLDAKCSDKGGRYE
jgi:hypothetical protein